MSKIPTNLTLHKMALEQAAKLQELLGYSSLSTLAEHLIREEYERRNGPIMMREEQAPYLKPPTGTRPRPTDEVQTVADEMTTSAIRHATGQYPKAKRKTK